jgi:hypothetical protein
MLTDASGRHYEKQEFEIKCGFLMTGNKEKGIFSESNGLSPLSIQTMIGR